MSTYISSNNNRFYVGLEASYGNAAESLTRVCAVALKTKHEAERVQRRDKTGSRTFFGVPANGRHRTSFELSTYMTGWADTSRAPMNGVLFEAALGGNAQHFAGGTIAEDSGTTVRFTAAHGLVPGQAMARHGEMRFVIGVPDAASVQVNAPFSGGLAPGDAIRATYTYAPAAALKSATVLDCWSPASAVQRMLPGAVFDRLQMDVNGDFHEFRFSGQAADVVDSASFASGEGGLQQFPAEPDSTGFNYSIVPGHLGQVWMGSIPSRVLTLASARLTVQNNAELRAREFGSILPRAIAPGERDVRVDFAVYAQDDAETIALYQAARQRSPMSVMIQLGQQDGQLWGVYLKSVMPEVPEYDDRESRLMWQFKNCRAQGSGDDEIVVAFG